jgi:hypothetical protein
MGEVIPHPSSIFGDSSPSSISSLVADNKGVIISIVTGSFLEILFEFDQPYEIFLAVVIAMFIWYLLSKGARTAAVILSGSSEGHGWQTAMVSYVDFISLVMIMFFSQYVTSVAKTEWKKAGFGKLDTIFVGIFFISYAINFLVLITRHPSVDKAEDYVDREKIKQS